MPDQFTPGPWLHKFNAREYERAVYAGHYQIAAVYGTRDSASPADEAKANARLIAAAPDMLAALRHAADFIATCQREGCPAGPVAVPSIIRDAITKASGE